jgi:hypothetical protein
MKFTFKIILFFAATFLCSGNVMAQTPVEAFAGNTKATVDIMFFKFFKKGSGQNFKWLFFNRNRASIDYAMTNAIRLPQFGFTEAISYNHKKLKGLAPVAVVQLLNRGVYPKVGIQYARASKDYTFFTWVVCETLNAPSIDWFFLSRYTPKLSKKLNLFTQIELVNIFPSSKTSNFNFIQRLRLGLKVNDYQFGLGADLTALGKNTFMTTQNMGAFLRHEF